MALVSELIVEAGVAEVLEYLAKSSVTAFPRAELEGLFDEQGVHGPAQAVDQFLAANLLEPFGGRLGISAFGRRTSLLIDALNGGDINAIFQQLRRLSGSDDMYEIVREGMTMLFFQNLVERPGFGRLYICSPWINPSDREAAYLRYAIQQQEIRSGNSPEVLVISRPPEMMPNGIEAGLQPFFDINAAIYFNSRLHSKLYIREPDERGGHALAIVGSENLTRARHLELGIRINGDTQIINQLIRYFLQLMSWSEEG